MKGFMSVIIITLLVPGGGAFFAARIGLHMYGVSCACTYSVRPASNVAWGWNLSAKLGTLISILDIYAILHLIKWAVVRILEKKEKDC
jgi:hypothetical protein